jgi:hypothetical protein
MPLVIVFAELSIGRGHTQDGLFFEALNYRQKVALCSEST